MIRYVLAAAALAVPLAALAQTHAPGMDHRSHAATTGQSSARMPTQPGQSAFAAIQEVVEILDADPATDWSKVDIDALRWHLVDMSNVTLHAAVAATETKNGIRFVVTGSGPIRESIRRMATAHAETMSGANGMTFAAEEHPAGAIMTVTVESPADLPKLKGLGFFGVMTLGMHHQAHHLMIAKGHAPHH